MVKNRVKPKSTLVEKHDIPSSSFLAKSKKLPIKSKDNSETNKEVLKEQQKKPFDKKLYRLKKYSKKYKLQQWEDNRKKLILKDFYKQVKDTVDNKFDVAKIYNDPKNQDSDGELNDSSSSFDNTKVVSPEKVAIDKVKKKPFHKAQDEFNRIKMDKQKKKEEFIKMKAEKEKAFKQYQKEKALKYRKLSKKTKKGQPIMKDRMEMLLEKIQKMT